MMQTGTTWRFTVHVRGADDGFDRVGFLERHLDRLQEELLKLEELGDDIHDADVGGSLATGEVDISLFVDLPMDEAVKRARAVVRTAIHASDGFTPSWDDGTSPPTRIIEYRPDTTELSPA